MLKPNGVYVFRTPNRFHYVTIAAQLMGSRAHCKPPSNDAAGKPRFYTTLYRMNSTSSIENGAADARLEIDKIRVIETDPWYGRLLARSLPQLHALRAHREQSRAVGGLESKRFRSPSEACAVVNPILRPGTDEAFEQDENDERHQI